MLAISVVSQVVYSVDGAEIIYLDLGTWMEFQDLKINYNFHFDFLASIMVLVISIVSTCVHIFSYEYMKMDPHYNRFISYLSLFTFFMLVLVSADNLIVMFFGWEGVGLCSYLLVGFWNTRPEASTAALKAFLYNRVGDIGLLLGFGLIFYYFRSFDFSVISLVTPFYIDKEVIILGFKVNLLSLIGVLLLFGIVGKSAQIGLHAWLPDSMEGPTPVSALIHAATMVTAGIFLAMRMSFFFEFIPLVLKIMLFLGSITGFTAGIISYMQDDIKKIIAFSTCSQLGYIIFMCGLSKYDYALLHLVNHAFFKALLFLSAGVVIHLYSNQDLRKINGINVFSTIITLCFLLGVFSLEGFFYFSSIVSKDVILEFSGHVFVIKNSIMFCFTIFTIFLTSMYASNLLDSCSREYEINRRILKKKPQVGLFLVVPLIILSIMTILSNMIFSKIILNSALLKFFIHPEHDFGAGIDILPFYFKLFIIIIPSAVVIPRIAVYKLQRFVGKFLVRHNFSYSLLNCFSLVVGAVICKPYFDNFGNYNMLDQMVLIYTAITIFMFHFANNKNVSTFDHAIVLLNFFTMLFFFYSIVPSVTVPAKMYVSLVSCMHVTKLHLEDKRFLESRILVFGLLLHSLDIGRFFETADYDINYNFAFIGICGLMALHAWAHNIIFSIYLILLKVDKFCDFVIKLQIYLYSLKVFNLKEKFNFLYNKIYYDFIVNEIFNSKFFAWSFWYTLYVEKGILEFMGPSGFCLTIFNMIKNIKTHFSGHKVNYICLFIFFLLQILWIWLLFF